MQRPSPACPPPAPVALAAAAAGEGEGERQGEGEGPLLVFDGGCVFCQHFALLSALRGGLPGLRLHDGRAEPSLLRQLEREGARMRHGAFLVADGQVLHGAEAIAWLCARMSPRDPLLRPLARLLASPQRARRLYPLLLGMRRLALAARGLSPDPSAQQR